MRHASVPRCFFVGIALIAVALRSPQLSTADHAEPKPDLPVILLTGFEPFGPQRPPNPSWEGIKAFDGREWRGHKLAARQIKVLWGEPLKELQKLIDEFHPVAVFAFGQGGGYALETLARNARGPFPDNAGNTPPSPTVIAGGPVELKSTLDHKALIGRLKSSRHDVRLSTDAGSYLCEEMLYTLEWLKHQGRIPGSVSFCHVPPLGAKGPDGPVTAKHIEKFVEDYLDAWHSTTAPQIRGQSPDAASPPASPTKEREQEVRQFIDRYFRTWSAQDIERYGQCFMPQAAIQLINENGQLITMPLGPFLGSQQESHRRSTNRMVETPETVEIRFDAKLAHALVYWKLVDGARIEYGYDHFTLMQSEGKWRIVNLIFYTTPQKSLQK